MEALLKDGSASDGHFDNLYRVITLTTRLTGGSPEIWSTLDSHSENLYEILTMTAGLQEGSLER